MMTGIVFIGRLLNQRCEFHPPVQGFIIMKTQMRRDAGAQITRQLAAQKLLYENSKDNKLCQIMI